MKYPVIFGGLPVTIFCVIALIFGGVINIRTVSKAIKSGAFTTALGAVKRQQKPVIFTILVVFGSAIAMIFLTIAATVGYLAVSRNFESP